MAFRTDRASLSLSDLRPPQQRADGSWLYDAIVTRSGVFEYELEGGGKRREWRPPEEVSDPASLETLQLAPVVIGEHTPKGKAREVNVGTVGETVRWDGATNSVYARVVVRDDFALRKIREGMHEVSCGYEVDLEETPGVTPEGERYDAIQRGMPRPDGSRGHIVYEHLAIVPSGRQGPQVSLRADSSAARAPRSRSWRTDAAHQTTSARAPGGAAASSPFAARSRSKDSDMAATSSRADCGPMGAQPEEKKDGPMPPPGGVQPAPAGPPMDPAKELEMLKAENAKLKAELAKTMAAQDAAAAAPAPRALDSADEDEDDMPGATEKERMDSRVNLQFERRDLADKAKRLGVSVRADAKRSEIKRAIVEHFDGKIPQERLDSLDAKVRRGYIHGRYEHVSERVENALSAEGTARGAFSPSVRADAATAGMSSADASYLAQQKRNAARSQRGGN